VLIAALGSSKLSPAFNLGHTRVPSAICISQIIDEGNSKTSFILNKSFSSDILIYFISSKALEIFSISTMYGSHATP
jgi:hypothetical protein